MTIEVRPARASDLDAIRELIVRTSVEHADRQPERYLPFSLDRARPEKWPPDAHPDCLLLVAEDDGVVAGFLETWPARSPEVECFVPRRYALVQNVVVRDDYRRRGIATKMLEAVEAWARSQAMSSVEFGVSAGNAGALAFYETLGYAEVSRRLGKALG